MVKIGVVGSISMDFVVTAKARPLAGQTLFGDSFQTLFGGKGANQAVASAKLGAETYMFGAVGQDRVGEELLNNLSQYKIHIDHVRKMSHISSGSAHITVVDGDNSILYVPGANGEYSVADLLASKEIISQLDLILVQNESPRPVVEALIDLCALANITIVYNPAPAREMDLQLLEKIDYFTPNESELAAIFPDRNLEEVLAQYPNKVIVTLGDQGVAYHDGSQNVRIPAYPVDQVVDTTGAGDTFNGAVAYALASGLPLEQALAFANLAGSISIQAKGAQTGIPSLETMKASEHYEETWHLK